MVAAFSKERSLVARFVLAKHNPRSNPSIERTLGAIRLRRMFSRWFSQRSDELLQLHFDRVRFLMEYLEQYGLKDKAAVVQALNAGLLLNIPENLSDPEARIWPDPSNKNLAISFYCSDSTHPKRVNAFAIRGFEELANVSFTGSAHEPYDGKMMWGVDIESRFSKVPSLSRALEKAIYQMPGWEIIDLGDIRFIRKQ